MKDRNMRLLRNSVPTAREWLEALRDVHRVKGMNRRSLVEFVIFKTDLGWVGLAAGVNGTGAKICKVVLPRASKRGVERELHAFGNLLSEVQRSRLPLVNKILREAEDQLVEFLAGRTREINLPVDLSGGTTFQRRVWKALDRIPYGRVRSYKWVAMKVGGSRYARAVGLACGANPVPLAIPCHRVVAHNGSLGGFGGGLALKRRLLTLEGTLRQLGRGR